MIKNKIHKILLVEDNHDCLDVIKSILELNEYSVYSAYNGRDAVKMAVNEKFDLIIIDYEMPVMNGIKAAKSIRESNKDVIIISISGRSDDEYINECYASGMNSHIHKDQIVNAIQNKAFEMLDDFINEGGQKTCN